MLLRLTLRSAAAVLAATIAAALSGCATGGNFGASSAGTGIVSATGSVKPTPMNGTVHGGQQPVSGAVVTLWAAGTSSGYGKGATAIASTLSDAQGNFDLNPATVTNITGYAIAAGIVTFTTSSAGTYTAGQTVVLGGFATSTFFNGQEVQVIAATPTSFTAAFGSSAIAATAESGTATYYNSAVSPCTAGQLNYITAVGGNPGLGGAYGTVSNTSLALMAALPAPCSHAVGSETGATSVFVDEVTTVAAVTALQQFMKINTAGTEPTLSSQATPPWTVGAPSTNTTGLTNAFTQAANLASTITGTSNVGTINSTQAGVTYTTTITPNSGRINLLADILSTCINSTGNLCTGSTGLFGATAVTPLSGGGTITPIDTIQAMYNIATNPAGLTMTSNGYAQGSPYNLCTTFVTATPPFSPTQACTATAYPVDWTINVTWQTNINGTTTVVGTGSAPSLALDSLGNIWTANTQVGNLQATLTKFNQAGQLILPPVTTVTIVGGYDFSTYTGSTSYSLFGYHELQGANDLAVDTLNNAWYASWYGATYSLPSGCTTCFTAGVIAQITPAGAANGYFAGLNNDFVAIDATNDVIFSGSEVSGKSYAGMLVPPSDGGGTYGTVTGGLRPGAAYNTGMAIGEVVASNTNSFFTGTGTGTTTGSNAGNTSNGYVWLMGGTTCGATILRSTPDPYGLASAAYNVGEAVTTESNVSGLSTTAGAQTCVTGGVVDQYGNLWGYNNLSYTGTSTGSYIEYVNVNPTVGAIFNPTTGVLGSPVLSQFEAAPTGSTGSTVYGSVNGQAGGGLYAPTGMAIDGAGNLWVSNAATTRTGGVSEFIPSISSTTGAATLTPLSPGNSFVYGFGNAGYATASPGTASTLPFEEPAGVTIDSSGNVWVPVAVGNVLNYIVGAAAPTVTPLAAQIANASVAKMP